MWWTWLSKRRRRSKAAQSVFAAQKSKDEPLRDFHPTGWQKAAPIKPDWLKSERPHPSLIERLGQRLWLLGRRFYSRLRLKWTLFLVGLILVLSTSTGVWLVQNPTVSYGAFWLDKTKFLGLRVEKLYIPQGLQTETSDLLAVLDIVYGQSILRVDLPGLVAKLEKMPWIKSVRIDRILPDQLEIHIQERQPVAIWQQAGYHQVVDLDGVVLPVTDFADYSDLPLILGQGSLGKLSDIISILQREPFLRQRVKVIARHGNRRWSVTLENGIMIHLPEISPDQAWDKLNSLQKVNNILDKDIKIIDLRLPDRIILQRRISDLQR